MAVQTTTSGRAANGIAPDVQFPLDSFKDAAAHLRRPFTPAAVKFKVQATWPKDNPTGGLIVAYIDARLAVERLNLIVPHLWYDEYEPRERCLLCRLTVDGITRQDVGEGLVKGLYSDALKRAAVKFGVGVSLYAIPKMMLNVSDGHLKPKRLKDGSMTLELTPAGEKQVRSRYETWLREHGVHSFGEPLNHGDSDNAQGDAEVELDLPAEPTVDVALATDEDVAALTAAAKGLKAAQIKLAFSAAGLDTPARIDAEVFRLVPQEKAAALAMVLTRVERTS